MTVNVPETKVKTTRMKKGGTVWLNPKEKKEVLKLMDDRQPKVTVIIPCSNQYVKICEAFNSVFPELGDNDRLIIADQGSTDGTNANSFAADPRITFIRYPRASALEIINFAIVNVVQTKYVMLLSPMSTLPKGAILDVRQAIGTSDNHSLILCKNIGKDAWKTQELHPKFSYTGYIFQKTDAINAGLFDISNEGVAPALFIDKMMRAGYPIDTRVIRVSTSYQKIEKVGFDQGVYEKLVKKLKHTEYSNVDLKPTTFFIMDKQMVQLEFLLNQVRLPDDEIVRFGAVNPTTFLKKFHNAVSKAKHDRIIILRAIQDNVLTYDSVTNLRVQMKSDKILHSGIEDGVTSIGLFKKLYMKPKGNTHDVDTIIKYITKKNKMNPTMANLVIHPRRQKTETTMRGGEQVEERIDPGVDTVRRKRQHQVVWTKGKGKHKKVRKAVQQKQRTTRVGLPSHSMKWNRVQDLPGVPGLPGRKPKVLLISDVRGWAWHYKSQQIQKHLSDEFNIDIVWLLGRGASRIKDRTHDLYVTFGYSYVDYLKSIAPRKKITGITAHRPHSVLSPQMRKAAVVHANSMMLYKELQTMHNIVYYLPNGVDEELFIPHDIPKERDNIVVGHVGKLSVMKGQEEYIKPAIQRAGAVAKFHFNDYTNAVPLNQMPSIYQGMDVFIVASKEDGTPNPALEAAACGIPIISNHIGNMPEFIEDGVNGFLVDKHVNAYVEKINWLRDNRARLVEMGQNARKTVEEGWTWRVQSDHWRRMFKEVLRI